MIRTGLISFIDSDVLEASVFKALSKPLTIPPNFETE